MSRRIEFDGGSVHVSLAGIPRSVVLVVLGWEDGTSVAFSSAVARQVAQALTEYALAAEQAAASPAVATTSQPASPLPAPAPAKKRVGNVGCGRPDGALNIHPEDECCEVCE